MCEPTQPRNLLIGDNPAETMSNCQQVLSIVELATGDRENATNSDDRMGYYLILNWVRDALKYEVEHSEERQSGNVTKLDA
ncbi:MAG: hypothetical protein O7C67_11600 [Gammaproteobacteria bacterium]|nr:hypothetical protein [Gammaproteobacteria bacterium]